MSLSTVLVVRIYLLCYFVQDVFGAGGGKKYDLQAEAFKLYKEDFCTVLQRFRRSSDYVKILDDQFSQFKYRAEDVSESLVYGFANAMEEDVKRMLDKEDVDEVTDCVTQKFRAGQGMDAFLRQGTDTSDNRSAVEVIESYDKLHSQLTTAERNSMKELAFKYAKKYVDKYITSLGGYCGDPKSTKSVIEQDQEKKKKARVARGGHRNPTTPMEPLGSEGVDGRQGTEGELSAESTRAPSVMKSIKGKGSKGKGLRAKKGKKKKEFRAEAQDSPATKKSTTSELKTTKGRDSTEEERERETKRPIPSPAQKIYLRHEQRKKKRKHFD